MIQQVQNRVEPEDIWPSDGLERVDACPVCGEPARSLLYGDLRDRVFFCAPGAWKLYRCRGCASGYLDPRPTPDAIGLAYGEYYTHQAPAESEGFSDTTLGRLRRALRNGYFNARYGYRLEPAHPAGAFLMRLCPRLRGAADRWIRQLRLPSRGGPAPRLLDVGCGNGDFLARMRAAGWRVQGVEPDPVAASCAQKAGLAVRQGTLSAADFPEGAFDAITLSHVIEHLHEPAEALRDCYRLLRPGGVLWIATPNFAASGHRLYEQHWFALDPPRHLVLFTPRSLKNALEHAGFQIAAPPLPYWGAEWIFCRSAAVAQGAAPLSHPAPLSRRLAWRVRLANLRAWLQPETGEELILLARKP